LEGHIAAAAAWCERMGPADLKEIAEDEVFDDFCESLKLRPLERRRLRKGALGVGQVENKSVFPLDAAGYAGKSAVETPVASTQQQQQQQQQQHQQHQQHQKQQVPEPSTGHSVFVKNTFLDLDDGLRAEVLRRSHTTPPPASASQESEDEESDPPPSDDVHSRATTEEEPKAGIYKTVTYDSWEPSRDWGWLGGDPNLPSTPEADNGSKEEKKKNNNS
ncbi:unnamed protein product, partial [Polarella glacialis]